MFSAQRWHYVMVVAALTLSVYPFTFFRKGRTMKRFTTFVALLVCTMIISGSVVQLRAQGPTAVGGGGTTKGGVL